MGLFTYICMICSAPKYWRARVSTLPGHSSFSFPCKTRDLQAFYFKTLLCLETKQPSAFLILDYPLHHEWAHNMCARGHVC